MTKSHHLYSLAYHVSQLSPDGNDAVQNENTVRGVLRAAGAKEEGDVFVLGNEKLLVNEDGYRQVD